MLSLVPGSPLSGLLSSISYLPIQASSSFTVSDQNRGIGDGTLAGAGAIVPEHSGGTITSATIDSGNGSGHFQISSAGVVTGSASGIAAGYNAGPYTLGVTLNTASESDSATYTLTMEPDTFHIYGTGGSTTEFDAVKASLAGKTIVVRTHSAVGALSPSVTLAGNGTIKGEDTNNKPSCTRITPSGIGTGNTIFYEDLILADATAVSGTYMMRPTGTGGTFSIERVEFTGNFDSANKTEEDFHYTVDIDGLSGTPAIGDAVTGTSVSTEVRKFTSTGAGTGTLLLSDESSNTPENITDNLALTGPGWTANANGASVDGSNFITSHGLVVGAGDSWEGVRVVDCRFAELSIAINVHILDTIVITGNTIENYYGDGIKYLPRDGASPPTVLIDNNIIAYPWASPHHVGNPHVDKIQGQSSSFTLTTSWLTHTVTNNKFICGDTFGDKIQVYFIGGMNGQTISGNVSNNLIVGKNAVHGIYLTLFSNGTVNNNTLVDTDPTGVTSSPYIFLGGTGNTVENNVAASINTTSSTETNNVELGAGGSTISYVTAFAPSVFTPGAFTLAEALTRYTPQSSGPLMAGSTWVAGDVGCIDSNGNHVPFSDTDAPTLSSASVGSLTAVGGTLTISTDEANGTLYWMVDTNATRTAAQVKTGGGIDSGSQTVTATGAQAGIVSTGGSASTGYYFHAMHEDAATNQSTVSSTSFTTSAGGLTDNFVEFSTGDYLRSLADNDYNNHIYAIGVRRKTTAIAYLISASGGGVTVSLEAGTNARLQVDLRLSDGSLPTPSTYYSTTTYAVDDDLAVLVYLTRTGLKVTINGSVEINETWTDVGQAWWSPWVINSSQHLSDSGTTTMHLTGFWHAFSNSAYTEPDYADFFDGSGNWVGAAAARGGATPYAYEYGVATAWNALGGMVGTVTDV